MVHRTTTISNKAKKIRVFRDMRFMHGCAAKNMLAADTDFAYIFLINVALQH
jgi:hypothetical protein